MPCADVEINIGNKTASIYTETNLPLDKHHVDTYSLFYTCNCCHWSGFYKTIDYAEITEVVKIATEKTTIKYISTLFSNFRNSIWQLPQIS
jgi:hypothetical protein